LTASRPRRQRQAIPPDVSLCRAPENLLVRQIRVRRARRRRGRKVCVPRRRRLRAKPETTGSQRGISSLEKRDHRPPRRAVLRRPFLRRRPSLRLLLPRFRHRRHLRHRIRQRLPHPARRRHRPERCRRFQMEVPATLLLRVCRNPPQVTGAGERGRPLTSPVSGSAVFLRTSCAGWVSFIR